MTSAGSPGPSNRRDPNPVRQAFDWLFRDRTTGRIVIAQWPNLPLWIFLAAMVVGWFLAATAVAPWLGLVGTAALLWWAGWEVVGGVNPFRRILGSVVVAFTLVGLVSRFG